MVTERGDPGGFAEVASLVQRLSVVLEAGLAPVSAWRHVAADQPEGSVASAAVDGLESSHELADRLHDAARGSMSDQRSAWAAVAAVWTVAERSGAPLGSTLARVAEVLRSLAQSAREVEVALSGPIATSRVVLALPLVGVAMGALLGFDLLGAFASAPGVVCLLLGAALIVGGTRWNRRLIRAARTSDATPGLALDLLAVAMGGGASPERARSLVDGALAEAGLPGLAIEADATLRFASAAGVPLTALLLAEADERRRTARSDAARRAVELETRLLLPLGLCILPAFILLGVAPVAIAIISSTLGSF